MSQTVKGIPISSRVTSGTIGTVVAYYNLRQELLELKMLRYVNREK